MAARQLHRHFIGIEFDSTYHALATRRIQAGAAQSLQHQYGLYWAESGFGPATSSLGIHTYVGSKSLARFCCELLNLQYLAKSVFSKSAGPNKDERDIGLRDQEFRAENPRQGGLHDEVIDRGHFSGSEAASIGLERIPVFAANGPIW